MENRERGPRVPYHHRPPRRALHRCRTRCCWVSRRVPASNWYSRPSPKDSPRWCVWETSYLTERKCDDWSKHGCTHDGLGLYTTKDNKFGFFEYGVGWGCHNVPHADIVQEARSYLVHCAKKVMRHTASFWQLSSCCLSLILDLTKMACLQNSDGKQNVVLIGHRLSLTHSKETAMPYKRIRYGLLLAASWQ